MIYQYLYLKKEVGVFIVTLSIASLFPSLEAVSMRRTTNGEHLHEVYAFQKALRNAAYLPSKPK